MSFRSLNNLEISILEQRFCTAEDWSKVQVNEDFTPESMLGVHLSGNVRLGRFKGSFILPGGIVKKSGIRHATLHDVTVGDDCCIENVKNYIARYDIADRCFIENVDVVVCEGRSTFGNGVEVSVLCETGGREVKIYDRLSSQEAYVMAMYRHRTNMVGKLRGLIDAYTVSVSSERGTIGSDVTIADTGYIKNVRIGDGCKIEGASRLKNGSINSTLDSPVHIGVNIIADDFIVCSGAQIEDGVTFSRCFVGQCCKLGHSYSASDSLFFANCQGENGEACAVFAGPFTVTHHKSTLLIAGQFSFMNAGSGSNQSNHMYKLGPIHQGIMERGAKTASDSYILWPAKVGAFSLVMGRHVGHQDTSDLPFSYLIEKGNATNIAPGANLKSVGTIRDAKKWPKRDARPAEGRLDCINYNLLSPYTVSKMLKAVDVLQSMQAIAGKNSEVYSYQSGQIKRSSLEKGLRLYGYAIDKFLGNSIISRLEKAFDLTKDHPSIEKIRSAFVPDASYGEGKWVDLSGLLAPKKAVSDLMDDMENDTITSISQLSERFRHIHEMYYDYEWNWAYGAIRDYYGVELSKATFEQLTGLVSRWLTSVLTLDDLVYEDARKEFSLSSMTGFGTDSDDEAVRNEDFRQVRGAFFDNDPFVISVLEHKRLKSSLAEKVSNFLEKIS